jgi:hypothetical protein
MCVTGQYHKSNQLSRSFREHRAKRQNAMNRPVLIHATVYILRLVIGLSLAFVLGGARPPAMDVVIEQLQIISPRQWLAFLTGSIGVRPARALEAAFESDSSDVGAHRHALAPANDNAPAAGIAHAS